MVVGELVEAADLIVIGGGPGGYTAALHGAKLGRDVTLVDDSPSGPGGICLHHGCIPSKALIELADRVASGAALKELGLVHGSLRPDLGAFQRWKSSTVTELSTQVSGLLRAAGVTVVRGRARFMRSQQLLIDDRTGGGLRYMSCRDVVLATGSRPVELGALPFSQAGILDSTAILDLDCIPDRLAVVGGGYIGIELAGAFARLGSQVTVVEAAQRILPQASERAARLVHAGLERTGAAVITNATVESYGDGRLLVDGGSGRMPVPASSVLVAVGRRPNSDALGLEAIQVSPRADGRLDVTGDRLVCPHVTAIGDLTPGPGLAHKAIAEAEVAVDTLCGIPRLYDPYAVPEVVFSIPEVAAAGVQEDDAVHNGADLYTVQLPLRAVGRAVSTPGQRAEGFLAATVDRGSGCVVGVEIVAPHASELIAEGVLAIEMGATVEDLAHVIHTHPTLSEGYRELGLLGMAALRGPSTHTSSPTDQQLLEARRR